MKDETIGNQQRRMQLRLSWLGGIIDGEGMVTVNRRTSYKKVQNGWNPKISVTNTDMVLINEVIDIFEELNIPHYVQSKKNKKHPEWKVKYEVLIQGMKRCNIAIPYLVDYLVLKKDKMINLKKWIDYRLSLNRNHPYTEKDVEMLNAIRVNCITPRDLERQTCAMSHEDTVRSILKNVENGRNDHSVGLSFILDYT